MSLRVPIRHWICSLPWGLRALLGYDRTLCAEVVSAFEAEVDRSLRWRAKRELGRAGMAFVHTGAAVAVQRGETAPAPHHLARLADPPGAGDATDDPIADEPSAEVRRIDLHAAQVVAGRDRHRVEQLCTYITRPRAPPVPPAFGVALHCARPGRASPNGSSRPLRGG